MEKNPLWKQPGPGMQIIAIVSSLMGNHFNFKEDIISKEKFNLVFEDHTKQLLNLADMMYNLTWDEIKNKELKKE